MLRRKPIDVDSRNPVAPAFNEPEIPAAPVRNSQPLQEPVQPEQPTKPKQKMSERVRGIFGSMFD
ncbi:cell division protein FtsA C-terminal domain-containing protein [Streptococcus huangxiaojuni]|uniref:cell division protein FtsA C-terminal domain-containing protein n=1 Tax=Streptococcus huangxiaojuni TaxID=3237239 RepID=UPI003F5EDBF7